MPAFKKQVQYNENWKYNLYLSLPIICNNIYFRLRKVHKDSMRFEFTLFAFKSLHCTAIIEEKGDRVVVDASLFHGGCWGVQDWYLGISI